jgi:lysozyme family protein
MKENFEPALARVLVYEGGLVKLPTENWLTNKGITQGVYNSWRARQNLPQQSVAQISDAEVSAIYTMDYWDRMDCDEMPAGVDFCLFDAAVNSGVAGATSWAQAVVEVNVDGDFGPRTKAAIMGDDPVNFIEAFNSHRLGTLQRLPNWRVYGKGWAARIANGEKTELAWAEGGPSPDPASVHTIGGHAKADPSKVPSSNTGVIIAHTTTVGGAIATGAAQTAQTVSQVGDFAWVKYAVGALTLIGALVGLVLMILKSVNDAAANSTRKAKVNLDADTTVPTVVLPKTVPTPVIAPGTPLPPTPTPAPVSGGTNG